ncbi:hypothetical protein B7494_g2574 [Chlorociboria aeruginascens]|nr:hypothetical protein B7494_g2574 [Chlorociboria aeruginascens]
MAVLATKAMGELNREGRAFYPLFEKPSKHRESKSKIEDKLPILAESELCSPNALLKEVRAPRIKQTEESGTVKTKQTGLFKPTTDPEGEAEFLEIDPNSSRRKRRKTIPEDSLQKVGIIQPQDGKSKYLASRGRSEPVEKVNSSEDRRRIDTAEQDNLVQHISPQTPKTRFAVEVLVTQGDKRSRTIPLSATLKDPAIIQKELIKATSKSLEDQPKKVLRLNPKTGTIGSPPRKIASNATARSKKSTSRDTQPNSKIIIINYMVGSYIGAKINSILCGSKSQPCVKSAKQPLAAKKQDTLEDVIPWWKKSKPAPKLLAEKRAIKDPGDIEISTFGDLTASRRYKVQRATKSQSPIKPTMSAFSGFRSTPTALKFPGAVEPAWPWRDMVHVRGNENIFSEIIETSEFQFQPKKSKYQAVQVVASEDIIRTLATELCIGDLAKSLKEINLEDFAQKAPYLRIPQKHFESGSKLQRRVRKQLHTRLPLSQYISSEDELDSDTTCPQVHPALIKAYDAIVTSLSAFDRYQREPLSWVQKYSPTSAAEVLQSGREALILKEWLQTLTVISVEAGAFGKNRSRGNSVSKRPGTLKSDSAGKRKRKSKKLGGFVISSDEEANDMDEILEPQELSPDQCQSLVKRTVIRSGDTTKISNGSGRLTNAVVLSGPSGCGKSAAVYAVAKELGFEVFEINSSSRRSGKDVLEKVGDMTQNHLVQRSHDRPLPSVEDEDVNGIPDALADYIQSSRQGTMNSLSRSEEPVQTKPKPKAGSKKVGKDNALPKAPAKQQKQSLILLEEVDILYEEDKQFWATVMALIAQSKRPIIMTCNDESAIPLQALSLHAIIRFTPAPTDLAVDYMLLIAANEGHVLQQKAVKALYESRNQDLRASLTELNFWCQFAVGDKKNGLSWICPRWPLGCDIDEDGNIIRVVSEGTYEAGMGWLCQDFLESRINHLDIEEETLHEAWNGWHVDLGDWQKNLSMDTWASKIQNLSNNRAASRSALAMYSEFSEAMSIADVCSLGAFAHDDQVLLDASLPTLSSKVRDDFVLAYNLIDTSPLVRYGSIGAEVSLWMKSRARNYLQVDQHIAHGWEIPLELNQPTESQVLHIIRNQVFEPESPLTRQDLSLAFDPISEPEKSSLYNTGSLEASCFDRTITLITTDIAPYIRSIVSYDARLQEDRARLSNLLSAGGRKTKRMRTTRSAMSALQGGARSTTRRDRYFGSSLNPYFVLKTGISGWLDAAIAETAETASRAEVEVGRKEMESGVDDIETSS